ncbi:hypothetical protein WJR50_30960 [Catalinimonas sp. 4WD22]|uniref:hypothetical protein n=1 Tax=Catalinimonas locisalis TaxID=3133978 RepID=UPI003100F5B5
MVLLVALSACDSGKQTERTLISSDTVVVETEYEVEKTIREKTTDIDTVSETETITRRTNLDSIQ